MKAISPWLLCLFGALAAATSFALESCDEQMARIGYHEEQPIQPDAARTRVYPDSAYYKHSSPGGKRK